MGRCRWATSFVIKLMILLCSHLSSQHIFDYVQIILQLCSCFELGDPTGLLLISE